MLIQCGHKLKVFGFKMGEWSNRWYSNSTYCEQVQNLFRTGFFSSSTAVAPEPLDDDNDVMVVDDECVAEVIQMFSDRPQVRVVQAEDAHDKDEVEEIPIVKFSEVISTFNAIASHVQNDQPELVKLLAFAQGVLKSYRKGLLVDLDFTTEGQENQIPTATSNISTTASKRGRLRSGLEIQRRNVIKKKAKVGVATTLAEANLMLERQTRGTKTCTLCGLVRHTAFKCDLIGDFGTPLTKGCLQSRMALISDLVNNACFVVCRIADDDHWLALNYLPKSVSAMILHTKCQLGREVVILETTLIWHRYVDQEFSKVLFKIEAINGWLTGSKQKPVVNLIPVERFHAGTTQLLQNLQPMGYLQQQLSQNFLPMGYSQQQLSQQQISQQFAQISQPSIPNMAMSQQQQHVALRFAQLSQNSIQSLPMSQLAAMSQQMHSFGNQTSYSQLQVDNEFQLQGEMGYGIP
jgi:hypothetical protein